MVSLKEVRDQIKAANNIGRVNLAEKGVTLPETATTCEIMQSITNVDVSSNQPIGVVCKHETSLLYIPALRIKTYHTVKLPKIQQETELLYKPAKRIKTDHSVTLNFITHSTQNRVAIRNIMKLEHNVALPNITHETEVL